jgi:FG-GAP-like repeat
MLRRRVIMAMVFIAFAGAATMYSAPPADALTPPFTKSTTLSGNIPPNTVAIVGDFDGDLIDDILWYGFGTRPDRYWKGRSAGTFSGYSIKIGGNYEPLTGDFDGDGNLDIFWYEAGSGIDHVWWGKGTAGLGTWTPTNWFTSTDLSVRGLYRPLIADFDNDTRTDILWYAPGTTGDTFWFGKASRTFTSKSITINGDYDYVTGGDFQGDGDLDLMWWRSSSIAHPVWRYDGGTTRTYTASSISGPSASSVPMVMNINGDLVDDLMWYGDGSASDAVAFGPAYTRTAINVSGRYAPLWGNFDGDNSSYDDVLWWGYLPSAHDSFWAGQGTSAFLSFSMVGLGHYDFDTHAPLLGYFGADEPLDVIFHDSQAGGSNAFFFGRDVDGASMSAHRRHAVRGRACGVHPVAALRLQCAALR